MGQGDASALGGNVLSYDELLAAEPGGYDYPELDERSAAAMCYTSGTTGNPKGVVYSHRSTFLHSLAATSGTTFALTERDRILPSSPCSTPTPGGSLRRLDDGLRLRDAEPFLQGEPLCKLIMAEKPTVSGAVPTVWNDILAYADKNKVDLTSLGWCPAAGRPCPGASWRPSRSATA